MNKDNAATSNVPHTLLSLSQTNQNSQSDKFFTSTPAKQKGGRFIERQKGTGRPIVTGDNVTVHYQARLGNVSGPIWKESSVS